MSASDNSNEPSSAVERVRRLLESYGVASTRIAELCRNSQSVANFADMVDVDALADKDLSSQKASLLVFLASTCGNISHEGRSFIVQDIVDERLKSQNQVIEAIKYFKTYGRMRDEAAFRAACGIGVEVSPEEINRLVRGFLDERNELFSKARWDYFRSILSEVKALPQLRWANTLDIKQQTEVIFNERFGTKDASAADKKGKPRAEPAGSKRPQVSSEIVVAPSASIFEQEFLANVHKPGENPQTDVRLRDEHLAETGGQVRTRFPPEPNGFLHIGHSKAIAVDFGFAKHHGGTCNLRYDDTNPEVEEQVYYDSILSSVRWLGEEPSSVKYSSGYFPELYALAVELTRRDKAYVCVCTKQEIELQRGGKRGGSNIRPACAHRDRPVQESLDLLERMRLGDRELYKMGATLRMKQDLQDPSPQMWDLVAYRFSFVPHVRTGDTWKIYPTYDYTHCLCDSLEHISHSFCTTEFVASRQSYEWLCHALDIYTPRQYEFGRLSLTHTILSKRALLRLVKRGYVGGWDDIRLYTLIALRRRGVPPEAIRSFVHSIGVTTASTTIELAKFEECVRQYLEPIAPRAMIVLHPVEVTIENLAEDFLLMVEKPVHPKAPALGSVTVPFSRTIYIESSDFREMASKDYLRLVPGGAVGLLYVPHPIICTSFETDRHTGAVRRIVCRYDDSDKFVKPKAYIQWVAKHDPSGSPVRVAETRIIKPLFKSPHPAANGADPLDDVDPDSLEVVTDAFLEVGFWQLARKAMASARAEAQTRIASTPVLPGVTPILEADLVGYESIRFQGLRTGYFAVDKDSVHVEDVVDRPTGDAHIVLNRTVSLKDDARKFS